MPHRFPDSDITGTPGHAAPALDTGDGRGARGPRGNDDSRALKARAAGYLSRREYSRVELGARLRPHARNAGDVEQVLDELEREQWLSDERFARALVHRKSARQGAARIVSQLRRHGLPEERLDAVRAELLASEFDRVREVWNKKFGSRPKDAREYGRQYRFLTARGFSADSVRRVLGDPEAG